MRAFVLALGITIALSSAALAQRTCSQAAEFGLKQCQGYGAARCRQAIEENRQHCLATGVWEKRDTTGQKVGPDIPNMRRE